jgi:aspartate aminotransferase
MVEIAKKLSTLAESPTLAITARAKELKKMGGDIVGFAAGEPDFDTPENIKLVAIKAIKEGKTKYTAAGGIEELKDAVREKFKKDNGADYGRDEVLVSCGGKHCLFNLFMALLDPADEVMVPAPYWVSYPPMIHLAGGVARIVETEEKKGFKLTAEKFEKNITKKTKALVINSPSNPTGAVYSEKEVSEIFDVAKRKGVFIVSDEIYEKLCYGETPFFSVASLAGARENSIVLNGVSKTYSMTGWRIGYAAGPRNLIKAMTDVQSQSTSNPASISQWAAVEALRGPQEGVEKMVKEFKTRRDLLTRGLNSIKGIECALAHGAFYVFAKCSSLYGKKFKGKPVNSSASFASYLLDEARVAVVPGEPFGNDSYIRLSYACGKEDITKGIERIGEAAGKLR